MAKQCELCGKKGLTANTRSHSMIATKCKQATNLQNKRIDGVKFKVCTRCIRTLKQK